MILTIRITRWNCCQFFTKQDAYSYRSCASVLYDVFASRQMTSPFGCTQGLGRAVGSRQQTNP
ncbi:MAG: hypothetical protein ACSHYA_18100 [Opitutaceae bacterium]